GIGLSISPVLGMGLGGYLVDWNGYQAVFFALCILALALGAACFVMLPETKPSQLSKPNLGFIAKKLFSDMDIWFSAGLVACFNVALFNYYLQGPFMFKSLGLSSVDFGHSGIALAIGTFAGSIANKQLIKLGIESNKLIVIAVAISMCGAIGVHTLSSSIVFLLPMILVVIGFGIGIPNILSRALIGYKDAVGSAGALFGLMYYLMIGLGLFVAAKVQSLGMVLVGVTSVMVVLLTLKLARQRLQSNATVS
ncbi:MFS transporter, partial [Vibrio paucivorans]